IADRPNSLCRPCTACKKDCPDIDLENNYWKEKNKASKRFAYYSFPGLVLGFYTYYYLYSGSWSYYFSGDWTRERDLAEKITSSGFSFLPIIPKWIAAPVTLAIFSLASFFIFLLLERRRLKKRDQISEEKNRYRFLAIASFCAFNLFYTFAGAPTF